MIMRSAYGKGVRFFVKHNFSFRDRALTQNSGDSRMVNGATLRNEERRIRAEKLLAEMEAVAEKFPEKSNVVAEIRRMRKKRTKQIWKNVLTPM